MREVRTHAHENEASLQPAHSGVRVGIGIVIAIAIGPCNQASPEQLSLVRHMYRRQRPPRRGGPTLAGLGAEDDGVDGAELVVRQHRFAGWMPQLKRDLSGPVSCIE